MQESPRTSKVVKWCVSQPVRDWYNLNMLWLNRWQYVLYSAGLTPRNSPFRLE